MTGAPQTSRSATDDLTLAEHHRQLDAACLDLLSTTYEDDSRELCESWRAFERSLEAHLAAEEELLIPAFAAWTPADAERLLQDHERIRRLVAKVGLEVELHVIRAPTIEALLAELRRHAADEEALLYPWASRTMDPTALATLRQRIASAPVIIRELPSPRPST
jgi:iron-sulfur cluster repair protein YtfE (RIC family)